MGSIVIAIVGLIIIVVCAYFYAKSYDEVQNSTGLMIGAIVVGVVVLIVGLFGTFGSLCKNKWLIRIYAIVLGVVVIAAVVVGVVAFVCTEMVFDSVNDYLDDYCLTDSQDQPIADLSASNCSDIIQPVLTYLCNGTLDRTEVHYIDGCVYDDTNKTKCECKPLKDYVPDDFDAIKSTVFEQIANTAKGNYMLVGGIGIGVALFVLFMTVVTCIDCICIAGKYDE